jgi:hypothetical protein
MMRNENSVANILKHQTDLYSIWKRVRRLKWVVCIVQNEMSCVHCTVWNEKMHTWWIWGDIALMMEAARTSETLVNFYQTTRCYNPEDSNLRKIMSGFFREFLSFQDRLLCYIVLICDFMQGFGHISRHDSRDRLHTRCVRKDWAQPEHAVFRSEKVYGRDGIQFRMFKGVVKHCSLTHNLNLRFMSPATC